MKKFLSGIICAAMLVTSAASAQPAAAENTLADALSAVKTRIEVPSELTGFDSRTSTERGETQYSFIWKNEENTKNIEVRSDDSGHVIGYWYSYEGKEGEKKLLSYTRANAQDCAEAFVKKALPEAFSGDDSLVCADVSGSLAWEGGTTYSLTFERQKGGIPVYGNDVNVHVKASEDGMFVDYLYSSYDYDADFAEPSDELKDPEAAYRAAFPLELTYTKDYEASEKAPVDVTRLIYTVSEYGYGLISAKDGEVRREKNDIYDGAANYNLKQEASADMAGGSSSAPAERFTEAELKELDNIAGLKSTDELEAMLRAVPELKMTEDMTLRSAEVYKRSAPLAPLVIQPKAAAEKPDEYMVTLYFGDEADTRWLNASLNARTGEIYNIRNAKYQPTSHRTTEIELTDAQKAEIKDKADAFFKKQAPAVYDKFRAEPEEKGYAGLTVRYSRMENGIKYTDNSASVHYDADNDMIGSYYISFTEAEFDDPAPAIAAEGERYDRLLAQNPLKRMYVRTEESGRYEVCFSMNGSSEINALTGEIISYGQEAGGEYTDIDGHWCESAVTALSEVGIAIPGSEFKPDEEITKAELLSYFSALSSRRYYPLSTAETMDRMKSMGIIPREEPVENGDLPVSREDACVYMVRIAGHEKIAKLDIFKIDFADSGEIAPQKLGSAAILAGMDVVCGDGGYLRPTDNITRAEAAVMLYKYLING